jgi:dimethylargininase
MPAGPTALVRAVGDSFARCVTARPVSPPLDPALARRQHGAYRAALEAGGFAVVEIPADEDHPDGCFVEDAAIVIASSALLTHPGHPSRRGEVVSVERGLVGLVPIDRVTVGSLDGGDVLQVGTTVFVGVGRRTDAGGADALERFARPLGRRVVRVASGPALHLKSAVTALDDDTVILHESVDPAPFTGLRVVTIGGDDPEAANVVRLPDGSILTAEAHPAAAGVVAALGYDVVTVDASEFARADGGLTCLSIRIRGDRSPAIGKAVSSE